MSTHLCIKYMSIPIATLLISSSFTVVAMNDPPFITPPAKVSVQPVEISSTEKENIINKSEETIPVEKEDIATQTQESETSLPPTQEAETSLPPVSEPQETIDGILDKGIIEILKSPEVVESYRVQQEIDSSVSDKRKLGSFNIIETGPELTAEQIKQFQAIIFDVSKYSLDQIKKCPFRPELGFIFKKGEERVEFLSSIGCDKYIIIHNETQNQGDYRNSARQPLLELRNSLFLKKDKGVRG